MSGVSYSFDTTGGMVFVVEMGGCCCWEGVCPVQFSRSVVFIAVSDGFHELYCEPGCVYGGGTVHLSLCPTGMAG